MGGQKKPTLTKLKKMLARASKTQKVEEKKKVVFRYNISSKEEEEALKYIMRMKYVTPSMLSRKMEIRISRSRLLLRKLASEGKLKLIEKNRDFELFVPNV